MNYYFDSDVAVEFGVNEAILIANLHYWISKNKANERHQHDGRTWTYNSQKAFVKLFPFWSEDQIYRIIKKLKDSGVILVGSFNDSPYDKTQWYAFNDEGRWLSDIDSAKSRNRNRENVECTGTDNKPDSKQEREGEGPIEFPKGFPKTAEQAVAESSMAGVPEDFVRTEWNDCAGRNGFDRHNTPVRRWAHHVKAAYDRSLNYKAERQQITAANNKASASTPRKPFISEMKSQIDALEHINGRSVANPESNRYDKSDKNYPAERELYLERKRKINDLYTQIADSAYGQTTTPARSATPAQH